MIWSITVSMMIFLTLTITNTKNPVKMSMLLLILVSALSAMMYQMSGMSWFPLIFYMLFLGGILIMFLILSTISPNEKMKKYDNKIWTAMVLTLGIPLMIYQSKISTSTLMGNMQWFMNSSYNMIFCISVIMFYFAMFTILISMEKSSLRTTI